MTNKHHGIVYYRIWQIALLAVFGTTVAIALAAFIEGLYGIAAAAAGLVVVNTAWIEWKLRDLDEQLNRDEPRIKHRKDHP